MFGAEKLLKEKLQECERELAITRLQKGKLIAENIVANSHSGKLSRIIGNQRKLIRKLKAKLDEYVIIEQQTNEQR